MRERNKNNEVIKWFYEFMLIVINICIRSVIICIVKDNEINVYIV